MSSQPPPPCQPRRSWAAQTRRRTPCRTGISSTSRWTGTTLGRTRSQLGCTPFGRRLALARWWCTLRAAPCPRHRSNCEGNCSTARRSPASTCQRGTSWPSGCTTGRGRSEPACFRRVWGPCCRTGRCPRTGTRGGRAGRSRPGSTRGQRCRRCRGACTRPRRAWARRPQSNLPAPHCLRDRQTHWGTAQPAHQRGRSLALQTSDSTRTRCRPRWAPGRPSCSTRGQPRRLGTRSQAGKLRSSCRTGTSPRRKSWGRRRTRCSPRSGPAQRGSR